MPSFRSAREQHRVSDLRVAACSRRRGLPCLLSALKQLVRETFLCLVLFILTFILLNGILFTTCSFLPSSTCNNNLWLRRRLTLSLLLSTLRLRQIAHIKNYSNLQTAAWTNCYFLSVSQILDVNFEAVAAWAWVVVSLECLIECHILGRPVSCVFVALVGCVIEPQSQSHRRCFRST